MTKFVVIEGNLALDFFFHCDCIEQIRPTIYFFRDQLYFINMCNFSKFFTLRLFFWVKL